MRQETLKQFGVQEIGAEIIRTMHDPDLNTLSMHRRYSNGRFPSLTLSRRSNCGKTIATETMS